MQLLYVVTQTHIHIHIQIAAKPPPNRRESPRTAAAIYRLLRALVLHALVSLYQTTRTQASYTFPLLLFVIKHAADGRDADGASPCVLDGWSN